MSCSCVIRFSMTNIGILHIPNKFSLIKIHKIHKKRTLPKENGANSGQKA